MCQVFEFQGDFTEIETDMNLRPLRPDQQKSTTRTSYSQQSQRFVTWVNEWGLERTFLGRVAQFLDQSLNLRFMGFLFLYCLVLSFTVFRGTTSLPNLDFKEGDLSPVDIRSPYSFEVIDSDQTDRRKKEAEDNMPPAFDFESDYYSRLAGRLRSAFRKMSEEISISSRINKEKFSTMKMHFEKELGSGHIDSDVFGWLIKKDFDPKLRDLLVRAFNAKSTRRIVEDFAILQDFNASKVVILTPDGDKKTKEQLFEVDQLTDVAEIKLELARALCRNDRPQADCLLLARFAQSLVRPNLILSKSKLEERRQQVLASVQPFFVQVKKNQIIVSRGNPIQGLQLSILDELKRIEAARHQDFIAVIAAAFFSILILSFRSFLKRFMPHIKLTPKDFAAMGSVILLIVILSRSALYLSNTALLQAFSDVPATFYYYLLPISAGAMIIGLLIPSAEVVWIFSAFLASVVGFMVDRNFIFMVINFAVCLVAARGIIGCKTRNDLYFAGIRAGFVAAALIFLATLILNANSETLYRDMLWNSAAGFMSGLISTFLTLVITPVCESLFVYTTDIKLLELSNLNHPLLKDMFMRAPGTYHHSMIVGSMCEAAAESIGANPLLAKVCAYYHDIGKTHYSQYFIENQKQGENRHDKINPGMSKTILVAHVKDGVELALKHKLGKAIIDVIEQHHGTTLISFFYHKAKETEDTTMHESTEEEYRYPGPKPQFREAALCMLADSIEAAARSLDEPTPARLQSIVRMIVQKKFLDGQLDECDLNLKDLTGIEEAFSKILLGIYHQRIDYPTGPKNDGKSKSVS